jgi:putative oxidoreductase
MALTQGFGADVVWDCIGGQAYFAKALSCLRLGGTVAVLASSSGATSSRTLELSPASAIAGEFSVVGVRGATRDDQRTILHLLANDRIRPAIDRTLPLAEASAAHTILEARSHVGKIVLIP